MTEVKRIRVLMVACLIVLSGTSAIAAQKAADDDGYLTAIHAAERKMIISDKLYRVALAARLVSQDGKKMALEDVQPGAAIKFKLDEETKDIIDLKIIAYP